MPQTLAVQHYQRNRHPQGTTISATIGGFEVWFRGAHLDQAPERGDPFLAVALIPAMFAGADLDLRDLPPVSGQLLGSLEQIQEIWTTWNPELRRIDVRANIAPEERPVSTRTGTFFSGGVDAVHAVVAGAGPGELLAFVNGFDFVMSDTDWDTATARAARLADKLGGELTTLETNWISFTRHHRIARSTSHGGCLIAAAHLLAPARMTIASSNSWLRITPWGTHNLLDPLWSTDLTALRHFGSDALRSEKVAAIAARPELLDDLWVCHDDPVRNCGRCTKCSRTMAVLQVIGATSRGFADTTGDPIDRYLRAVPRTWEKVYLGELRRTVVEHGADRDLLRRIDAADRALNRRVALRELRHLLLPPHRPGRGEVDLRPWGFGPVPES